MYAINQQTNPIGRNEYLRTTPPVELSNENLLDAQRATVADIEKNQTDVTLRERYNDLAIEYGVRINRGEQLESDEDLAELERLAKWFFENDAVSIDDEDFQAFITAEPAISAAKGISTLLHRPAFFVNCDELPVFISMIERRLSNMDDEPRDREFLMARIEALRLDDSKRHDVQSVDRTEEREIDFTKDMTAAELAKLMALATEAAELNFKDMCDDCHAKLTPLDAHIAGYRDFMHGDSDEPEHPSLTEDIESIRAGEFDPIGPDGQPLTLVEAYAKGFYIAARCCRLANEQAARKATA